jgi:4-hydroxybenzoate polyprenyltransferase
MIVSQSLGSDITSRSWVDAYVPIYMRPYFKLARYDRPIGMWLLLFPSLWGLAFAGASLPPSKYLFLYCIGAILMRGAGCTYNDIVDQKYDQQVNRTRTRPLVMGEINLWQALIFLVLQLVLAFCILLLLPKLTIVLGTISVLLVMIYPWMKRFTYWPQAFLGITFNWGILMGWSTITGRISWASISLYLGGIFWTIGYDTIYAHQDKHDDALIGVKSTALKFANHSRLFIALCYTITLISFYIAGNITHQPWFYNLGIGVILLHFVWQIFTVDLETPAECLRKFKSNKWIGGVLLATILGSKLLILMRE